MMTRYVDDFIYPRREIKLNFKLLNFLNLKF